MRSATRVEIYRSSLLSHRQQARQMSKYHGTSVNRIGLKVTGGHGTC